MAENVAKTPSMAENLSLVQIRIGGLRLSTRKHTGELNNDESGDRLEASLSLPKDAPLSELWNKLEEAGFEAPYLLTCGGDTWHRTSTKLKEQPFEEIEVIQGKPSEPGQCVNIHDSLISYANRQYGKPIELNIAANDTNEYGFQIDSLKDSGGLEISLHRTIRMPDDDKLHQLPGSLGPFPLYNVVSYKHALPEKIMHQGGIFIPMWQREALWMSFDASSDKSYALRVSIGRVNAISGLKMNECPSETENYEGIQDYVVVPGQEWLDGICVAPGIVRQFVAMPLGSGYTVEGQKTGEEKHGGLQIEIIPSFEIGLRTWVKDSDCTTDPERLRTALPMVSLDECKTPSELGLDIGTKIRSYPQSIFTHVDCRMSDIAQNHGAEVHITSVYMGKRSKMAPVPSGTREHQFQTSYDYSRELMVGSPLIASGDTYSYSGDRSSFLESGLQSGRNANILSWGADGRNESSSSPHSDSYLARQSMPVLAHAETTQAAAEDPTPSITTKDLKAMGLAAGGKLVQDIYRDHHPSRIWNTAASKLVHIHILDPASCEAVTHIVPPPPPVDAMGYVESGGQFFVVQEQPEGRVEGGDFVNVKSVSAMDKEKGVAVEPSLDPSIPTQCRCGIRLCDCVVRPCDHIFCNVCVREIDPSVLSGNFSSAQAPINNRWHCPTCKTPISHVAGFAAPMNLPGEESVKVRVPVNVLEVRDGRVAFKSVQNSRI